MPPLAIVADAPARPADEGVLTDPALVFLAELVERFGPRVQQLLKARGMRQSPARTAAVSGRKSGVSPASILA